MAPVSLTALVKDILESDAPPAPNIARPPAPTGVSQPGVPTGRVYSVATKQANLRTGPGDNYQLLAILNQGTVVLVTEADPAGKWLRVATPDGASGFMAVEQLSPDVRIDALEDIGGFGKGGPPTAKPAAP